MYSEVSSRDTICTCTSSLAINTFVFYLEVGLETPRHKEESKKKEDEQNRVRRKKMNKIEVLVINLFYLVRCQQNLQSIISIGKAKGCSLNAFCLLCFIFLGAARTCIFYVQVAILDLPYP